MWFRVGGFDVTVFVSLYSVCPVPIVVHVALQCMPCSRFIVCHSTVYVLFPLVRDTLQCMSCSQWCVSLYSVCPVPIVVRVTLQCMSCSHFDVCHSAVYVLFPS